jgi:tRNA threonylcarbamoyladenosine biosynthesis protein TsaE
VTPAVFQSATEEDTIRLAAQLAANWPAPGVVLLIGNLGAGKTTFAKGIAEGLGVTTRNEVSSPTFPLIHEYGNPVRMYHVDLYRLDTLAEVQSLGLEDIFDSSALVVMEWAERFPNILPDERTEIQIIRREDGTREIRMTGQTGRNSDEASEGRERSRRLGAEQSLPRRRKPGGFD